ncbi:sugar ABC transporter substrate-binding protein [Streptomyces sp. B6B3]|uniref:ABC transporter substrate-binding protein n=1 Tax=Streptomyces sp. B6B3 TaxID=3153570 RepID=UPI00325D021C
MRTKRLRVVAAGAAVAGLTLAGCGEVTGAGGPTTITYALWDTNQLPAYQECAEDFERANPDIDIRFDQRGWDFYWSTLALGMVSESAPDVFTDHLTRFPDWVTREQILPLDEYIERDNVDLSVYQDGLADLWMGPDGKRYGLPKDFDAVAIFYNKDMLAEAGITEDQMNNLTWNPDDGGSYEDVIAHLTVDANGVRGDEPGFDKNNVETYGLWMEESGGTSHGQTQWSMYAASTGWLPTDTNPWGTSYNYGDQEFLDTIAWWRGLVDKGYMPSWEAQEGVNWADQLAAGNTAMATNGSWMTGTVFGTDLNAGIAPTPVGPSGERASMFNGLSDSIYAGTEHPEESWRWVKYLGSLECQQVVAEHHVVFPAITEAAEVAEQAFADEGIDVSPFMTHVENDTTMLFPVTEHPADVITTLTAGMEAVMSGQRPVDSLVGMNRELNRLFD